MKYRKRISKELKRLLIGIFTFNVLSVVILAFISGPHYETALLFYILILIVLALM